MGFRCHWRQCGYIQLHGRHAYGIGLGQSNSIIYTWTWWSWISGCDWQAGGTSARLLGGIEQGQETLTATGNKNLLEAEYTGLPGCMQVATKPEPPNSLKTPWNQEKELFFVAVFLRCLLRTKLNLMWADKEEKFIGSSSIIWEQGTEGWVDLELRVLNC